MASRTEDLPLDKTQSRSPKKLPNFSFVPPPVSEKISTKKRKVRESNSSDFCFCFCWPVSNKQSKKKMADPMLEEKMAKLQRLFGNQCERDVLEAVLGVCGGDVKACEAYLTAGQGDFVDPGPAGAVSLPQGYNDKPMGYSERALKRRFETKDSPEKVSVTKVKDVIFQDGSLQSHMAVYQANPAVYSAVVGLLLYYGVDFPSGSKPKILATAFANKDRSLSTYLLSKRDEFQMIDILRSLKVLDTPRKIREVEKRIAKLVSCGAKPKKVQAKTRKLNEMKNEAKDIEGLPLSVSGSTARKVRKWVSEIEKETLEFYLMQMPVRPWQELADIIHPAPSDFQCHYFLATIYGAPPPEDSIVARSRLVPSSSPAEVEEILHNTPIPFSFLRKNVEELTIPMRERVAEYESLDTLIWWHHELACPGLDDRIRARLEKGEQPKFSYGKFMERLLYFKEMCSPFFAQLIPIAEKRLTEISLPLEPPVMVIGDASFSMDVAIRTSTIIASLMVVLSNAKLRFFNDKVVDPPLLPKNASQVIEVTEKAMADGLTAPAASIWDLYKKKEKVRYFIMVTDEIENEKFNNTFFAQLFYKYCMEVFPARLVFISFLEDLKVKGRMVQALESFGIVPLQFKLDSKRPDLTKMDSVLGILSSESNVFPQYVQHCSKLWSPTTDLHAVVTKAIAIATPELIMAKAPEVSPPNAGSSSSSQAPAPSQLAEEVEEMGAEGGEASAALVASDDNVCSVCFERPADIALVPCGHLAFCHKCSEVLNGKPCPLCMAPVTSFLKIFHA